MKKWWKSKTLWVNVIGIGAILVQTEYGYIVTPEIQVLVLGFVNMFVRLITKEELE